MSAEGHDRPGRTRWLVDLRRSIAEQIESCRDRLDGVEASLEDVDHPGPLPIEARAGLAAEVALDLAAQAWQLQRATVSCGADTVVDLSGVPWHGYCTQIEHHEGDCDANPTSPIGRAAAAVFSLARSTSAVTDQAFRSALRLDQASADGTRPVLPSDLVQLRELAQELGTIADGARIISEELHRLDAQMGGDQRTAEARLALASGRPADAPEPGLGGVG